MLKKILRRTLQFPLTLLLVTTVAVVLLFAAKEMWL